MRPHEEDQPEEYRGAPRGEPRPQGPPEDRGRSGGAPEPSRQSRYQSPPPRGPPPEGPPAGSQQGSPPTRVDRAREAQEAPPGGPPPAAGSSQPGPPPAGGSQPGQPPTGSAQSGPPPGGPAQTASPRTARTESPQTGPPESQPPRSPGSQSPADVGDRYGQPPGWQSGAMGGLVPAGLEEIVQTEVVTASPDTPVATVVAEMAEEDVGSVVVVDEEEPVGIVTDRSIALALETTPDVTEHEVGELLEGEFVTGSTEMSGLDVLRRLSEAGVRRLPIVDEDGGLAGIVTLDDVLVLLSEELANVADVVRTQSPRL